MNKAACLKPGTKTDWETPPEFYANLDSIFHFTFDPCPAWRVPLRDASGGYAVGNMLWDGLSETWDRTYDMDSGHWQMREMVSGCAWANPPYGNAITRWIEKAILEFKERGVNSVFLLPARTDTKWFHLAMQHASEIGFVKGRITFVGGKASAAFPSCLIIFDGRRARTGSVVLSTWDNQGNPIEGGK